MNTEYEDYCEAMEEDKEDARREWLREREEKEKKDDIRD